jgi:hypothetical protein
MAPLSEWLELMLAEIARRQEEAQLNAEEEARRQREAPATSAPGVTCTVQSVVPTGTTNSTDAPKAEAIAPSERRRRRG